MTKYLAKNFINLSSRGFGSDGSSELCLNHTEGGFNVRPLMIMLQEGFSIEVVEMPHAIPQAIKFMMMVACTSRIDLKWDIGRRN